MEAKSATARFSEATTGFGWPSLFADESSSVFCRDPTNTVTLNDLLPQNELGDGNYGVPQHDLFGDNIDVLAMDSLDETLDETLDEPRTVIPFPLAFGERTESCGCISPSSAADMADTASTASTASTVDTDMNQHEQKYSAELKRPAKQQNNIPAQSECIADNEFERLLTTMPKSKAGRKKKSVTANMSKNALAARENREKKKRYVEKLENAVRLLSAENEKLRRETSAKQVTITSLQARVIQGLTGSRRNLPPTPTEVTVTTAPPAPSPFTDHLGTAFAI